MFQPCRVIKVGGSLFDLPDLPQRLRDFLKHQSSAVNVLIAGGGRFCDLVREADRRFALGEIAADALAIRAMHTTAGLLAKLLCCREVSELGELQRVCSAGIANDVVVFDVSQFVRREQQELPGRVLPIGWQTTSDSIAARVAELLAADELVLLKSCAVERLSLEQLAVAGIVDAAFPQAAARCARVRAVNLRDA